jgi:hypothetical protein
MAGPHVRTCDRLKSLGKLLACQAWLDIREGRRAEGLHRLRAVARLGCDIATGSTKAAYLSGVSLHLDVAMVIADTLCLPGWQPGELRDLARGLKGMVLPPFWQCVRVELLVSLAHVAARESAYLASMSRYPIPLRARLYFSRLEALSVEEYDRRMLAIISALQRHDGSARARVERVYTELVDKAERERAANWMSATTIPNTLGPETVSATLELTTIALRARAMYLSSGRFPQSLADLKKSDGLGVPPGPFNEPFKIIRTRSRGVVVYDTGADRQDDLGRNEDVALRRTCPPRLRSRSRETTREALREMKRSLEQGDDMAIVIGVGRPE